MNVLCRSINWETVLNAAVLDALIAGVHYDHDESVVTYVERMTIGKPMLHQIRELAGIS